MQLNLSHFNLLNIKLMFIMIFFQKCLKMFNHHINQLTNLLINLMLNYLYLLPIN